jgi:uracil-DNA glycosylase
MSTEGRALARLIAEVRRCRVCRDHSRPSRLPHEPRPVLQAKPSARLLICGQAPGVRAHASGVPFADASGERLRAWLAVTREEFYDPTRVAIVPVGLCFPGHDAAGGDLPPRAECAPLWQARILAHLPRTELMLLVGGHAQRWHLGQPRSAGVTETVARWRQLLAGAERPRRLALPHPSWHNNHWLAANAWFAQELLPAVRREIRALL